jgi:DNA (cytosine-5)-methyltransferase 1
MLMYGRETIGAMKVTAVDLFCGSGGLSYGLQEAGISIAAGVDKDPDCKYAFEANIDAEFRQLDIKSLAQDPEPIKRWYPWDTDVQVLAACAPCQPYSTMSHQKDKNHEDHDKWGLLKYVKQIVEQVRPDVVVTENVLQVRNDEVYDEFVESLENMGYHINSDENKNVYCPDYGVPQKRKRWVLMASKQEGLKLPEPENLDEDYDINAEDHIGHLPPVEAGEPHPEFDAHRARNLSDKNLERIDNMEPGGDWRLWEEMGREDLLADCHKKDSGRSYKAPYSRMVGDEPAPTITTQFYNYGSGRFGHYDTDQNRALTLLEGAVLQTFPEDYEFYDEWDDVGVSNLGRLIGNAVPPLLGKHIGEAIMSHVGAETGAATPAAADD